MDGQEPTMNARSIFIAMVSAASLLNSSYAYGEDVHELVARDPGFKFDMGCPGYKTIIRLVDPNSPAFRAGLLPGDEIISMSDRPIIGLPSDRILKAFHSSKKPLKLTILRDDQLLDFTVSRYFVIPAWSEAELLRQLKTTQKQEPENRIACLLNVGRFYDEKNKTAQARPFYIEAMQLADKHWNPRDPRRVRILNHLLTNELLADRNWIKREAEFSNDFSVRIAALFELTDRPSKIPKYYADLLFKLSNRMSVHHSKTAQDLIIKLLQRAIRIGEEGNEDSNRSFEALLGARENVENNYDSSEDSEAYRFSKVSLIVYLEHLTKALVRAKRLPEATRTAKTLRALESELRKQHIPALRKSLSADLLVEIYQNRGMDNDALLVAEQEIAYLRGRPGQSDPLSEFESKSALSYYLMKSGILRERVHAYKDATKLFQQSFMALRAVDDKPGSPVDQGYKFTTSRQRQKALWSEARCAAALGRYDDAKRLLRNAIAYDEDTIFKMTPTLDLALICLLNNEHEEAREMVIDMITTIKSNPRRAAGMTNLGIVEREIRLLNALGEQDKADDLIETLSEYFLKDRFLQKVRPARVSELNKLRTRLNSGLSAHEKLPAQKLKKLSIEKPITRCFLTFYECYGRE